MVKNEVNRNWDINRNGHNTFHTVTLILIEDETVRVSAKKTVMVINILQMICIGYVLEAPGQYQQTLL